MGQFHAKKFENLLWLGKNQIPQQWKFLNHVLTQFRAKVEGRLTKDHMVQIEKTIDAIFAFADEDGNGELEHSELVAAIKKDPNFAFIL